MWKNEYFLTSRHVRNIKFETIYLSWIVKQREGIKIIKKNKHILYQID
jgi:hypothetical protein